MRDTVIGSGGRRTKFNAVQVQLPVQNGALERRSISTTFFFHCTAKDQMHRLTPAEEV